MNRNIYLACALTHVPRDMFGPYVEYLHGLASSLVSTGARVRYALVDSDPQLAFRGESEKPRLCYQWDRQMVEKADLVVADASFPSTGLGIELQISESRQIPIILAYLASPNTAVGEVSYQNPDSTQHQLQIGKGHVSLMALGLPMIRNVIPYTDYQQAISALTSEVARMP